MLTSMERAPRLVASAEAHRANMKENFQEICAARNWENVRDPDGNELFASEDAKVRAATYEEEKKAQIEVYGNINFSSPLDRDAELVQAFSRTIYKRVYDQLAVDNPISLFYDMVKQTDLDEVLEIHEFYGGKVYPWSYGATRLTGSTYERSYQVLVNPYQLGFRFTEHEIKTGRRLISEISREAARCISAHKVKIGMDALGTAYTDAGTYTTNGSAADLSATNLKAALRRIRNLTEVRAIVGCHSALQPIYELAGYDSSNTGYAEDVKLEIHRTGRARTYMGAPLVPLMNYTDPLYATTIFTAADVFVIPVAEKTKWNVYVEYGTGDAEPIVRDPHGKNIFIYFYWEDNAYVDSQKIQYGHRIRNNATA